MSSRFKMLFTEIDHKSFKVLEAIIVDEIFALKSEINQQRDLAKYKLVKARQINPDFEEIIAEMICGEQGNSFPYRKGYQLTPFFKKLGFNFEHDGSTRRFWVRDMLYQLDIHEISKVIKQGLFNRFDYKKLELPNGIDSAEEAYQKSLKEFRDFIDDSFQLIETADLDDILDLNINADILFNKQANTKDSELNKLLTQAKDRFLISNDKQIALEKIWDAFERLKTYYGSNKKKSANQIVEMISSEIEKKYFEEEFYTLTKIGNEYRIRHHETNKIEIKDRKLVNYLFFRMLTLIDFCTSKINSSEKN